MKAGERRQIRLDLRKADGILAMDLSLVYDPSQISIQGIQASDLGSGFNVVTNDSGGTVAIGAYGVLPLAGSGSVLTITVEALKETGPRAPMTVRGQANEGQIPLRTQIRIEAPSRNQARKATAPGDRD